MKKSSIALLLMLTFLIFTIPACDNWVTNVEPLINQVQDDLLDNEDQMPFVINGVLARFTFTLMHATTQADLLSDAIFFDDDIDGATYPTYDHIDQGEMFLDNTTVTAYHNNLHQYRFLADDLLTRAGRVTFTDAALENRAKFVGSFHGGIARTLYAMHFGLDRNQPGGVLDAGPFIPQADMYNLAIQKLNEALNYADAAQTKMINTLLARIHLNQNNYAQAAQFAANGMVAGDAPFQAPYLADATRNEWWVFFGRGRTQGALDWRFKEYADNDPQEAHIIAMLDETDNTRARVLLDTWRSGAGSGIVYYRQGKYLTADAPINYLTWQENNLILAECALNGAGAGDPLALVNEVRQYWNIADLNAVDMEVLKVERDKELMGTGIRHTDQLRWGDWHLHEGSWKYLPIPMNERNENPNIS
jgi:starch-binding outer membrane protein, SusD/RagB family